MRNNWHINTVCIEGVQLFRIFALCLMSILPSPLLSSQRGIHPALLILFLQQIFPKQTLNWEQEDLESSLMSCPNHFFDPGQVIYFYDFQFSYFQTITVEKNSSSSIFLCFFDDSCIQRCKHFLIDNNIHGICLQGHLCCNDIQNL